MGPGPSEVCGANCIRAQPCSAGTRTLSMMSHWEACYIGHSLWPSKCLRATRSHGQAMQVACRATQSSCVPGLHWGKEV